MNRKQLEHVLRAAGVATGHRRFVLIGSAAVFAWRETVSPVLAISREVDLFVDGQDAEETERVADELDGVLGQASSFDETFGYHCDGVGPETAILPLDWRDRAGEFQTPATGGVMALAPEPNDLALSKLAAGRAKDMAWLLAAADEGLVDFRILGERLSRMPDERVPGGTAALASRLSILERKARAE